MKRNLSVFLAAVLLVIALVPTLALAGVAPPQKLQPPVITGLTESQTVQQGDEVWLAVYAYSPNGDDGDGISCLWFLVENDGNTKHYTLRSDNNTGCDVDTSVIGVFTYVAMLWSDTEENSEDFERSDSVYSDEITITVVAAGAEKEKPSCPTIKSLISNIKNKVEAKVEKVEAIVVSKVSTLKSKISDLLNSSKKNDDKKNDDKKKGEKEEKEEKPKQETPKTEESIAG